MKFKIPKEVDIGPHTIPVKIQHLDDNAGEYHFGDMEIRISDGMKETAQHETYWHEIVEAVNHIYELGLPHRSIQILGAGIAQAIKSSR